MQPSSNYASATAAMSAAEQYFNNFVPPMKPVYAKLAVGTNRELKFSALKLPDHSAKPLSAAAAIVAEVETLVKQNPQISHKHSGEENDGTLMPAKKRSKFSPASASVALAGTTGEADVKSCAAALDAVAADLEARVAAAASPLTAAAVPLEVITAEQLIEHAPELGIVRGLDDQGTSYIKINGKPYLIKPIGKGTEHIVYEFVELAMIDFGNGHVKTDAIKVRAITPKNVLRIKQVINSDKASYARLKNLGVPLPLMHKVSENGKVAVVESLIELSCNGWHRIEQAKLKSLDLADRKVLQFVRYWLEASAKEAKILIEDFFPRNVMKRAGGSPVVSDWMAQLYDPIADDIEDNWVVKLYKFTAAWSNQSHAVFQFLIANFPQDLKTAMRELLVADIHAKGAFPEFK